MDELGFPEFLRRYIKICSPPASDPVTDRADDEGQPRSGPRARGFARYSGLDPVAALIALTMTAILARTGKQKSNARTLLVAGLNQSALNQSAKSAGIDCVIVSGLMSPFHLVTTTYLYTDAIQSKKETKHEPQNKTNRHAKVHS